MRANPARTQRGVDKTNPRPARLRRRWLPGWESSERKVQRSWPDHAAVPERLHPVWSASVNCAPDAWSAAASGYRSRPTARFEVGIASDAPRQGRIQRLRNFTDPQTILVEPDVTCLVGKSRGRGSARTSGAAVRRAEPVGPARGGPPRQAPFIDGGATRRAWPYRLPRWQASHRQSLEGSLLGGGVGCVVVPAVPDHEQPGAGGDAHGVGWSWPRARARS